MLLFCFVFVDFYMLINYLLKKKKCNPMLPKKRSLYSRIFGEHMLHYYLLS